MFDKGSKVYRLVDTGSMISTTSKLPEDKLNPIFTLQAVNNPPMPTYGFRVIPVKIGRKTYEIEAVIVDLKQEILGMDFLRKFKLGLDWIEGEYCIFDRKSQIQESLSFVTVSKNQLRTQTLVDALTDNSLTSSNPEPEVEKVGLSQPLAQPQALVRPPVVEEDPEWVAFQVAAMRSIDRDANSETSEAEHETITEHETSSKNEKSAGAAAGWARSAPSATVPAAASRV